MSYIQPSTLPESLSGVSVETLKSFACELADAAAEVTLKYFRQKVDIDNKLGDSGFDPVTEADQGAERAIRALIDERFPDHSIHGEEYGIKKTDSPFEWVLDPVDGTRAFISGLPTWGTLIALKHEGVPVIGVLDQPYIKERYLGWTEGATLNGEAISTRSCASLSDATISTTDPDLFKDDERTCFNAILNQSKLIRYGMDCYAYGIVAAGFMDLVIESGLKPYDMMALIPIVRGAGGSATNWQGQAPGDCGKLLVVGDKGLLKDALHTINE